MAVAFAAGCAQTPRATYQTPVPEQHRDGSRAAQLNRIALDALEEGDLEEAEYFLKEALTVDVMYGPAHNNLGRVYQAQGQYYLAAWEYEYAAKLMPGRPEPKNNLGLVFEAAQRHDDAIAQFAAAYRAAPDNAEVVGNYARARVGRGDRDDQTRELLEQVYVKDQRPDWRSWAQRELATRFAER